MALITYIEHDGTEHKVQVEIGSSVMHGAIDNGLEGIVAECGGACSCATCHCYVDDAWIDKTGRAEDMEEAMIECVSDPRDGSRLSCQIEITEELDGLVVHLPESQY